MSFSNSRERENKNDLKEFQKLNEDVLQTLEHAQYRAIIILLHFSAYW